VNNINTKYDNERPDPFGAKYDNERPDPFGVPCDPFGVP
jgi:hypothetical protein